MFKISKSWETEFGGCRQADRRTLLLEEKGYLDLVKALGSFFHSAQINFYGIDLVEDPNEFNTEFPIQITQNIIQGNTGVIIGDSNIQTITISDSFKPLYEDIERKNPKNKEQIISEIKKLEDELKKETPNKSTITQSLNFLKENASWIIPTLTVIIKAAFGL